MINWQPDYKNPILLITMPRTGSHWFSSGIIDYYSLGEIFTTERILLPVEKKNYLEYITLRRPRLENKKYLFTERLRLYTKLVNIHTLHIFKFHAHQVHGVIEKFNSIDINFIKFIKKYNIVYLKRRDLASVFWSLMIAKHLFVFWNKKNSSEFLKRDKTIVLNNNILLNVVKKIKFYDEYYNICQQLLPSENVIYYENLLEYKNNLSWFNDIDNLYQVENRKKEFKFINNEQIAFTVNQHLPQSLALEILNNL